MYFTSYIFLPRIWSSEDRRVLWVISSSGNHAACRARAIERRMLWPDTPVIPRGPVWRCRIRATVFPFIIEKIFGRCLVQMIIWPWPGVVRNYTLILDQKKFSVPSVRLGFTWWNIIAQVSRHPLRHVPRLRVACSGLLFYNLGRVCSPKKRQAGPISGPALLRWILSDQTT